METEVLDLHRYFRIIFKKLWFIALVTICFTLTSTVLSFQLIKPVYQAKIQLLVNDTGFIPTYQEFLLSPIIMDPVAAEVGNIEGQVSVESTSDSQVISITVEDKDEERASLIAKSVATTFQQKIVDLMQRNDIHIITEPKVTVIPIKPKLQLNIGIAFILGLIISTGIILLMEYLNPKFNTEDEVKKYLKLPILARIPVIKVNKKLIKKQVNGYE